MLELESFRTLRDGQSELSRPLCLAPNPGPFSPLVAADTFLDALPAFSFLLPFVGRIVVLPTFAAFALLLSANGLWFSFLHPRGNPRVNHLHHSFITLSSLFA